MASLPLGGMAEYLDALDNLLRDLIAAAPKRLDGKRRDFRALTDEDRWWDLLSELLVARWMTSAGVFYEFGAVGRPQPDLVMPDRGLGVEVTRRARRVGQDLRMAVRRAARAAEPDTTRRVRPRIVLNGQPLSVRAATLAQIEAEVEAAVRRGDSVVHAVLRPARDGKPAITAEIDLWSGFSVMASIMYLPEAAELTVTMLDIEDLIVNCLEDRRKSKQGESMPTLLLIDTTRLSDAAWLRPTATWARRLPDLLKEQHTFAGVGIFAMSLYEPPRLALGIAPWASSNVHRAVVELADALGIVSTPTTSAS